MTHALSPIRPHKPQYNRLQASVLQANLSRISLLSVLAMPCIGFAQPTQNTAYSIEPTSQPASETIQSYASNPILTQALTTAKQKNLANSVAWRRFLYFADTPNPKGDVSRVVNRFNSAANQRKFFVADSGSHDPQAELQATLTALFDPTLTGDKAVACRFPARVTWLKQQLNLSDAQLPAIDCPSYQAWQAKVAPPSSLQSASIVFANEYLDSLPSAFAHSFLRFDSPEPYYLNYTPRVVEGENQAKFAYKSAIAGNAGEFAIINYAQGIQDYKVNQGRDVWAYRLKLSETQLRQLTDQVYEIKDQILPYYLLDKNCASEILVLLNTLFPQKNYLANLHTTIAPAQLVRRLQQEGLIEKVTFEPSATTRQQAKRNLTAADHPITTNDESIVASRNDPQLANPLRYWSLGYAYQDRPNADSLNALQLGYRLVYHDPLDRPTGYPIGSQLTGLSADVLINPDADDGQNTLQIEQATLIKLRSFNPVNTAKHKSAWGLDVGLQQAFDKARYQSHNATASDKDSHLVGNIGLEYGKSVAYGSPLAGSGELPPNVCYALGNLATQFGKGLDKGFRVGVGANVGCLQQFGDNWRGLFEVKLPYWLSGDNSDERYWQPSVSIGTQYDLTKNHAFRLLASREFLGSHSADTADKVSVSYVHYYE